MSLTKFTAAKGVTHNKEVSLFIINSLNRPEANFRAICNPKDKFVCHLKGLLIDNVTPEDSFPASLKHKSVCLPSSSVLQESQTKLRIEKR